MSLTSKHSQMKNMRHFGSSKYQPKAKEPEQADLIGKASIDREQEEKGNREKLADLLDKGNDLLGEVYDDMLGNSKEGTCCICEAKYTNYGHNAQPVKEGRCCDECQEKVVLPARNDYKKASIDWRDTEKSVAEKLIRSKTNSFDPDKPLSKEYIKASDNIWGKLQKKMPLLWQAMMTRRYVLPQYRQLDYYNQQACDYLMLDFLMEFTQGNMRGVDEVLNTQYVSLVRSLECGRPALYLEKEFAPVLMKSPIPEDYDIGDIKWRFPSFRVYLPKGFLTIKRQGEDCSLMFMDIVKVEKNYSYSLPLPIIKEIRKTWGDYRIPPFQNMYSGMGVSGNLDFDCIESSIAYAGTTPTDATTIKKVMTYVNGSHPLITPLKSDTLDDEFTSKMIVLALKILLFLSSYEIIPDPVESDVIRKPVMVGDRQITGLYHAKFVGSSAIKLTESGAKARGIEATGRTVTPHWVSGHWQRICHGPKSSLRKLVWIGIYHTGKENV